MIGAVYQNITVYRKEVLIFTFPFIVKVEINTSRESFTDIAIIEFPRKTYSNNKSIGDYIKVGDEIRIEIGYENYIDRTFFNGYITGISPKNNVIITVEDEAFLYKTEIIEPKIFRKVTLSELIKYYYKKDVVTVNDEIGDWVVNKNATLIDMFDELRQKLGVQSYWQKGVLYVGAELLKRSKKTLTFDIKGNVPINTDNIETNGPTDVGVVSCGISTQKDGKTIERYAYYKDATRGEIIVTSKKPLGSINTMKIPNITEVKLDYWIKRRLPNLYTNINSGDIKTFGVPSFEHGDRAKIINSVDTTVNGIYDIIAVNKLFSAMDGFKQTATIGMKVKNIS